VKVAAAGVNFIDIYQREGLYTMPLPYTPGLEGAGVVVDVGTSVATFAPGDQVAWAGMLGSYAEMIALDADAAVAIPEGVSLEHAAQAMLQGMTAHYLVTSVWEIQPGQTALVHAAAGGVGLLLCQMITARGGQVIGTVSTDAKATAARAAGASHIIRYDTEDVPGRVREIVKEGVDVVYDGVGRDTFMGSLKSLRPRGMVALFGQSSGPVEAFDPQLLNQGGSLIMTRPSLAHFTATPGELQWRAGEVLGSLASGSIHFALAHRYPLSEAGAAHAALKARTTSGKLIIIP
jgi:NADPH2:quinone reductase